MKSHVRAMSRAKHEHLYSRIVKIRGSRQRWGCDTCPAVDPYWYRIPGVPVGPAKMAPEPRKDVRAHLGMVSAPERLQRAGFVPLSKAAQAATDAMLPPRATTDTVKGVSGPQEAVQGATGGDGHTYQEQPMGFNITKEHRDPDGTRVIDGMRLHSMGPDKYPLQEGGMMVGRAQTPPPLPTESDIANVKDAGVSAMTQFLHFNEEELKAMKVPALIDIAKGRKIDGATTRLRKPALIQAILDDQKKDFSE